MKKEQGQNKQKQQGQNFANYQMPIESKYNKIPEQIVKDMNIDYEHIYSTDYMKNAISKYNKIPEQIVKDMNIDYEHIYSTDYMENAISKLVTERFYNILEDLSEAKKKAELKQHEDLSEAKKEAELKQQDSHLSQWAEELNKQAAELKQREEALKQQQQQMAQKDTKNKAKKHKANDAEKKAIEEKHKEEIKKLNKNFEKQVDAYKKNLEEEKSNNVKQLTKMQKDIAAQKASSGQTTLKLTKELETRNEEFKELKALKDISDETNLRLSTEAGEKEKTRNKIRQEEKDNVKKEFFVHISKVMKNCLERLSSADLKAIDYAAEFLKTYPLQGETLEQVAEKLKLEVREKIKKENVGANDLLKDLANDNNIDFVTKTIWPDNEEYKESKNPCSQLQDFKEENIQKVANLLFQVMNKRCNPQNKNKGALIQEKEALIKDEIWQDNVNFEIDNTFNKDFMGNVEDKTEKM